MHTVEPDEFGAMPQVPVRTSASGGIGCRRRPGIRRLQQRCIGHNEGLGLLHLPEQERDVAGVCHDDGVGNGGGRGGGD